MPADDSVDAGELGAHPTSGGACADSGFERAGGCSPWASMSIGEILGIVDTMNDTGAAGDAAAVQAAITAVHAAADSLDAAFGTTTGGIVGAAVDASAASAAALAARMRSTAGNAAQTQAAMTGAATTLSATRTNREMLESVRRAMADNPENAPALRAGVEVVMSATYTIPMNTAQAGVPGPAVTGDGRAMADVRTGSTVTDVVGGGARSVVGGGGSADPTLAQPDSAGTSTWTADPLDQEGVGTGTQAGVTAVTSTVSPASTARTPTTGTQSRAAASTGDRPLSRGSGATSPASVGAQGLTGSAPGPGGRRSAPGSAGATADDDGQRTVDVPVPGTRSGDPVASHGGPVPVGGGGGGGGMVGARTPLTQRLLSALPVATVVGTTSGATVPAGPVRSTVGPFGAGPHAGRERGRDGRHTAASYLHTTDNGAQIVGALPLVGPPVIGGWAVARPSPEDVEESDGADPPVDTERPDNERPGTERPGTGDE
ncbi:hypothetical protein AAFP30_19740 [Gordonia sp. CPCC 205515]|uniref:hypothetical protein n=1 Tax=Gordonia sp. CPCC 205515 TaxID=3140791 RepID=UPI003AF3E6FC